MVEVLLHQRDRDDEHAHAQAGKEDNIDGVDNKPGY